MDDLENNRIKVCLKCGSSFTCSILNCWCAELPKVIEMPTEGDCYCPKCLNELIESKNSDK